MGDTDLKHPGHVVELPNFGNDVVVGGAVFGGCSYCFDGDIDDIGRTTILSGVAH